MAITFGKLEGRITVPSGGWVITTGAGAATVPAGDYYLGSGDTIGDDLLQELDDQLTTATGRTWTCTMSGGEAGTGIVTLTVSSATTITWTSTDLRDVLGFTGNLGSATSFVGTQSARSIWMPNCPYVAHVPGAWDGKLISDKKDLVSARGDVFSFAGQLRTELALRWDAVSAARCFAATETTVNQSFEKFWRDVIYGEAAWSTKPGGPVRFHRDAATDGTYTTYQIPGMAALDLAQLMKDLGLFYRVELPMLIKEPT